MRLQPLRISMRPERRPRHHHSPDEQGLDLGGITSSSFLEREGKALMPPSSWPADFADVPLEQRQVPQNGEMDNTKTGTSLILGLVRSG
uniref:Uncharacterized protein P0784G04.22 n=1 Tax=Oryza sativa subsp. japonica TaxID=39947 RepID=Q5F1V8_ORYSJ|nr:hypothetical protein [Oryza sativa Japonica Group]